MPVKDLLRPSTNRLIFIVLILLFLPITLPALAIWYIWKKTNLERNHKILASAGVVVFGIVFAISIGSQNQVPIITILEPTGSVQAAQTTLKGRVEPKGSRLVMIGGQEIPLGKDGSFALQVALLQETNMVVLEASHGSGKISKMVSIQRTYSPEEKQAMEEEKVGRAQEQEEKRQADLVSHLQTEIKNVETFDGSSHRESAPEIQGEVVLFSTWARLAKDPSQEGSEEIRSLSRDLSQKLSTLQTREFPLLRKAWGDILKAIVWENDVDVKVLGSGNSTLDLTGYYFASNGNIKKIQETISDMLTALRFSRVNYKWTDYGEYTYFDLQNPADGEVK